MFDWPLINDSFTPGDKKALTEFINQPNVRLTQGQKVKDFEKAWADWVGVKHSLFVNSGASANFMMFAVVNELLGRQHLNKTGRKAEIITSPLGWVSDVSPVVLMNMKPVFVDVSMENMSMTYDNIKDAITEDTVAINLVHVLGFNAMSQELIDLARDRNLILIEDCCESHGATFNDKRIGSFGDMSNFSFYFGHHITTVEGGMVCTNDDKLYDYLKLFRSHGMTREASESLREHYIAQYPDVNPLFTFAVPGLNFRNQELNAVLGLSQLPRLDYNCAMRMNNLQQWLSELDGDLFYTNFYQEGNSNFALPLIAKSKGKKDAICQILEHQLVEYRIGTAGGGNQVRQPYLNNGLYEYRINGSLKNTNWISEAGLYVGNHPELTDAQITDLTTRLNNV